MDLFKRSMESVQKVQLFQKGCELSLGMEHRARKTPQCQTHLGLPFWRIILMYFGSQKMAIQLVFAPVKFIFLIRTMLWFIIIRYQVLFYVFKTFVWTTFSFLLLLVFLWLSLLIVVIAIIIITIIISSNSYYCNYHPNTSSTMLVLSPNQNIIIQETIMMHDTIRLSGFIIIIRNS